MSDELDLLKVALAVRLGFVSPEQVREAGADLPAGRGKPWTVRLREKGFLSAAASGAVDAAARAIAESPGGPSAAPGQALAEEELRRVLLDFPMPDGLRETLLGGTPPEEGGSVLPLPRTVAGGAPPGPGAGAPAPGIPELREGKAGRYAFRGELGRGGLGRVLEALDNDFGRPVAVKIMLPGIPPAAAARFLLEARAAGRLTHPNIVPVHEVGVLAGPDGSRPYFTMARIAGRDLSRILADLDAGDPPTRKKFGRHRLLQCFLDVCHAVAYAHDHGVIHRDLKPANVMVGDYGEVYVVDWGLAKIRGRPDVPDAPSEPADVSDRGGREPPPTAVAVPRGRKEIEEEVRRRYFALWAAFGPGRGDREIADALLGELRGTFGRVRPTEGAAGGRGPAFLVEESFLVEALDVPALSRAHAEAFAARLKESGARAGILLNFGGPKPDFHRRDAPAAAGTTPSSRDGTPPSAVSDPDDRPPPQEGPEDPGPLLTREGDVLGTPSYMPPEQAEGRIAEIDERSDVYSLGAILYEILTLRPPFEGDTIGTVISRILTEEVTPPSQAAPGPSPATRGGGAAPLAGGIPPALDEIVLRALAKDKARRFSSARELAEEIQAFLEGEKQRDYNRRQAEAKAEEGLRRVEALGGKTAEAARLQEEVDRRVEALAPHEPVEAKRPVWELEANLERAKGEAYQAFSDASRSFQEALGFESGFAPARAALADLYWSEFLRAEAAGDLREKVFYENLVRQNDDGRFGALLKGDGKLALSTSAFPCRCLLDGRTAAPEGLEILGFHLFSGRHLGGAPGAAGLPALEPAGPVRLRAHGPACAAVPLPGAEVWLFRFREVDKRLKPVAPEGMGPGAEFRAPPAAVLDALYGPDSPDRPSAGAYLGRTPVGPVAVPMGSYLAILSAEGHRPVRLPVRVDRLGTVRQEVVLYREAEVPADFVQVPAGPFRFQGDPRYSDSAPLEIVRLDDFFVARHPVTCSEYLGFLNDLAVAGPPDGASRPADLPDGGAALGPAERRAPRKTPSAGFFWPRGEDGRWVLPTEEWARGASPEALARASKLDASLPWWEADWPVVGVSWEDMASFAHWVRRRTGRPVALVHDVHWEKAARGADGRFYPWGDTMEYTYCNNSASRASGKRIEPVTSYPADESPYGVRGLAGNTRDLCLNFAAESYSRWRVCRGGFWIGAGFSNRAAFRTGLGPEQVDVATGSRLALYPRLPALAQR